MFSSALAPSRLQLWTSQLNHSLDANNNYDTSASSSVISSKDYSSDNMLAFKYSSFGYGSKKQWSSNSRLDSLRRALMRPVVTVDETLLNFIEDTFNEFASSGYIHLNYLASQLLTRCRRWDVDRTVVEDFCREVRSLGNLNVNWTDFEKLLRSNSSRIRLVMSTAPQPVTSSYPWTPFRNASAGEAIPTVRGSPLTHQRMNFLEYSSLLQDQGIISPINPGSSSSSNHSRAGPSSVVSPRPFFSPVARSPRSNSNSNSNSNANSSSNSLDQVTMVTVSQSLRDRLAKLDAMYSRESGRSNASAAAACRVDELEAQGHTDLSASMELGSDSDSDDEGYGVATSKVKQRLISYRFQPIDDKELSRAKAALNGPKSGEVLMLKFNIDITREKFSCLRPLTWLNDEIINFYMNMLQERDSQLCSKSKESSNGLTRKPSHFFNSFFMEKLTASGYNYSNVRRWSKKVNIFEMDKVFFPINISNTHWTFAVIFVSQKRIAYYDSMSGAGRSYTDALLKWLVDEAKDKRNEVLAAKEWTVSSNHFDRIPQQRNGSDCGVFTIIGIDFLSDDLSLAYDQSHMSLFRLKIASDILRGSLSYPL